MADALFSVIDDTRVEPSELSRGPWSLDSLHGGPVAALVSHFAETALSATGSAAVDPVRLTIDIERPVPLAPLVVRSEIVRPGHKVQVAEVTVHDESGTRLARASVLAIRRKPIVLPSELVVPTDHRPPSPDMAEPGKPWDMMGEATAFHRDAIEHRLVGGGLSSPGPCTDWMRLRVPVVDGESPSPFQRVVAAADFVNGISWVLPFDRWLFINPDLTVTVHRLPQGEWVAVDAVTRLGPDGTGTAEGELFDESGRIGRCVQTLLIEPR